MKTKFTPGPWISVGAWVEHPDDSVADICTCNPAALNQAHLGRSALEVFANANLIAAAPDMYEALEAMLNDGVWVGDEWIVSDEATEKANNALAKARGEA